MPSVIFRTHPDTLGGVLKHAKYALQVQPNLVPGDTILLAHTLPLLAGEMQICYRMIFVETYEDRDGETDGIWGRHWRYIIRGNDLKKLRRPFNIAELPVLEGNYGQGGPFVYFHPRDEKTLQNGGYLDVVGDA